MAKKKLNFEDVEAFVKCEEGEHIIKLVSLEEKTTANGDDMLTGKFQVVKGNSTGAIIYDNFVLTQKALWKLKLYLESLGVKADGKVLLDTEKLKGKVCIAVVSHEEYNGNEKAKIDTYKKFEKAVEPKEKTVKNDDDWDDEWDEE